MNAPSLQFVIEQHRTTVMRQRGVVGIAVGLSKTDPTKHCIQVFVTTDQWPDGVPRQLGGYPVELVKSSGFHTL